MTTKKVDKRNRRFSAGDRVILVNIDDASYPKLKSEAIVVKGNYTDGTNPKEFIDVKWDRRADQDLFHGEECYSWRFKLLKKGKGVFDIMRGIKYIVRYDDPNYEEFASLKEANERISELVGNGISDIYLIEVAGISKVVKKTQFEMKEIK